VIAHDGNCKPNSPRTSACARRAQAACDKCASLAGDTAAATARSSSSAPPGSAVWPPRPCLHLAVGQHLRVSVDGCARHPALTEYPSRRAASCCSKLGFEHIAQNILIPCTQRRRCQSVGPARDRCARGRRTLLVTGSLVGCPAASRKVAIPTTERCVRRVHRMRGTQGDWIASVRTARSSAYARCQHGPIIDTSR